MLTTSSSRDNIIQKNFSKAAANYDSFSTLHRDIALSLCSRLKINTLTGKILEIGCGTGHLTGILLSQFPRAKICAIDFSGGMVAVVKNKGLGADIVQADARALPFKAGIFDLIVSNLTYQWVKNLPAAFKDCYLVLRPKGEVYLTVFGINTFNELFISLEESLGGKNKKELKITRLAKAQEIEAALEGAGFKKVAIKSEKHQLLFGDVYELLRWAKNIGANGLEKNFTVGKDLLRTVDEFYRNNFGCEKGIPATLEVYWVKCEK